MQMQCQHKDGFRNILVIVIDDEPWREIHTSIFGRKPPLPTCQSIEDFNVQFQKLEYQKALHYALKRLSLKNQPSTELRKTLLKNLISESTTELILMECQRLGYINDTSWLAGFIRSHQARKTGPQAILSKLHRKGISPKTSQTALEELYPPESQRESIQKLLSTRYSKVDLNDFKARQKVIGALMRKGFSWDEIRETIVGAEDN